MLPKLTVIALGAVALVSLAALRAVRAGTAQVPAGTSGWVVTAFAAALVLATLSADNVSLALFGQHGRYAGLLSYLAYLSLFLVVTRLYAGAVQLRGLLLALMLSLALVSAYGLLQAAGLDPYTWSSGGLDQTFSTMGNINFAAGYIASTVPVAAAVVVLSGWSSGRRGVALAILLASLGYLMLTKSAQGPVAAAAGLSVVGVAWLLGRHRVTAPKTTMAPASRLLVPVSVAAAVVLLGLTAARLMPTLLDGLAERRYFWGAALAIFADHPFLGTGLDSFRDYFTQYRAPEHGVAIGFDGADSVHNLPLGMLAAGGLPLALTYMAFVGYTGWALADGLRSAKADGRLPLAAFGGMWVAFQVQSLVSLDVPPLTFLHFLSAAIVLGSTGRMSWRAVTLPVPAAARGALVPRGRGRARRISAVALAVVAVLGVTASWWASRPMRAELAASAGLRTTDPTQRVDRLDQAVRLAPWEAEYRIMQGQARLETGQAEAAYESVMAVAGLRRGSSRLALGAADFARRAGDDAKADAWITEALRRDPSNPFLLEEVAALARGRGDQQRADDLVQRAQSLRSEHGDY